MLEKRRQIRRTAASVVSLRPKRRSGSCAHGEAGWNKGLARRNKSSSAGSTSERGCGCASQPTSKPSFARRVFSTCPHQSVLTRSGACCTDLLIPRLHCSRNASCSCCVRPRGWNFATTPQSFSASIQPKRKLTDSASDAHQLRYSALPPASPFAATVASLPSLSTPLLSSFSRIVEKPRWTLWRSRPGD